jgi:phage baseplate assembly protein W
MNNQPIQPSIFGRSFHLVNGDLHLVSRKIDNETLNDLAIVVDRDNFMQGMQVMIDTPFGTDIFNVNYGFDFINILSQPNSIRLTKELIRLNIVKSLSQDNRVREIREIVFDDDPRFFELNPQENFDAHRSSRKAQRHWQAIVVVETISEGEVALKLEGVEL